jgi:phage gpG-like protein
MTLEQLKQQIEQKMSAVRYYVDKQVYKAIGEEAVQEFTENFDKESFDGKKWQNVKRRDPNSPWYGHSGQTRKFSDSRTTAKILDGETGDLRASTTFNQKGKGAIISNEKEYAIVHNEGFDGVASIPSKTRKEHTVKEHKRRTKDKTVKVKSHKREKSVVKPYTRTMQIPRRQFIGATPKLIEKINDKIERDLTRILNS